MNIDFRSNLLLRALDFCNKLVTQLCLESVSLLALQKDGWGQVVREIEAEIVACLA